MWRYCGVLLCVITCSLAACKQEVTIDTENLSGHWAVSGAERNGRKTALLNGAIFQFQEDGTMHTNITGEEHTGPFEVNQNKILFAGRESMVFEINALIEDTLSLNATIQGNHFLLELHRTTTESQ